MNTVAALLYLVAVSVLTGLALSFGPAGLTPDAAAAALGAGVLVGFAAWWRGRGDGHKLEAPRGWGWVPVVLFALFACRSFLWLIWWQKAELKVLASNNIGDMSLHLTFIEQIRHGITGWPDSPIYSGGKLSYAVGMDYFNGLLALIGVDVVHGLIWVGLIGAVLTGLALWRWGGAFTLMGFLCIGGLVGFAAFGHLLPEKKAAPTPPPVESTEAPGAPSDAAPPAAAEQKPEPFFQDYAGFLKFDWAWKSLPLALLVTQRGFLFALPAGLLLLSSWRSRFFGAGDGWRLPFFGELLLYAAMPVFHVHTFLVLSFLLAMFFICQAGARWRLTVLVGCALIPATVLLWLTTGMGQATPIPMWGNMSDIEKPPDRPTPHVLGWQPGWMAPPSNDAQDPWKTITGGRTAAPSVVGRIVNAYGGFLGFWLGNFGLWPFVAAALALVLLREVARGVIPKRWVWGAALCFVLVTPLLGMWETYQKLSLADALTGPGTGSTWRFVVLAVLAAAAFTVASLTVPRTPRRWIWRIAGFAFAGLVLLSVVLVVLTSGEPAPKAPVDGMRLAVGAWGRFVALLALAGGAFTAGWLTAPHSALLRGWRVAAFTSAGLALLNAILVILAAEIPKFPPIPVNALPLMLATAACLALLVVIGRRWESPRWPCAFVFPALYLFFLCCNVRFAPSAWDNTKMMIWAVLIVMPFLWELLIVRWSPWARAVTLALLFFSGFVGLLGGLSSEQHGYFLANGSELDLAEAALRPIPRTETIAAAPIYNHPLLLNGRRLVLGYEGHVTSHGLPDGWHKGRLNTLMNGDDEWRIAAAELGVRYLWWGRWESEHWPRSHQSWRKAAQVIADNPAGQLFDLEAPLAPIER